MRLDIEREKKHKMYSQILADLQDAIGHERCLRKDERELIQRQRTLDQNRTDLAQLRSRKENPIYETNGDGSDDGSAADDDLEVSSDTDSDEESRASSDQEPKETRKEYKDQYTRTVQSALSNAQADWDYQKRFELAQSDQIDALMGMIGLENVKTTFLAIKAQVDIAIRQNVDLTGERFGTVLLGNPGTGKFPALVAPLQSANLHR